MALETCELLRMKHVLDQGDHTLFFKDLKLHCENPMEHLCDNKSAISISIAHNHV